MFCNVRAASDPGTGNDHKWIQLWICSPPAYLAVSHLSTRILGYFWTELLTPYSLSGLCQMILQLQELGNRDRQLWIR